MIKEKLKNFNYKFYPEKLYYSPSWLVLGVNNICNLHYKMCDVGLKNTETNFAVNLTGTKPINMPLDLFKLTINQAEKYFPSVKIGYAFTKPLIYPYLIESLEYAQQKKFYTSITTNALTLKTKASELVDAGLNDIFISLDGPEDIHNQIRGHKSSFQRAIDGIEELLKHKNGPDISIFCVITEWNIGYLKEFVDFFSSYPLKQIGFMHTNFTNKEMAAHHNNKFGDDYPSTYSNTEEINISNMNLELVLKEIQKIKGSRYSFPVTFSPELTSLGQLTPFYHHPQIFIGKGCNDVRKNVMIKSDGSVIPAHGRCYNLTIGNIYQSSLKEIWNSSVIAKFRKTLTKNGGLLPACSRCCSAF